MMDRDQTVKQFKDLQKTLKAYNHASGIISVDGDTAAPKGSYVERGETLSVLTQAYLDVYLSKETEELLARLEEVREELDPVTKKEYEHFRKEYEKNKKIPVEEQVAYSKLLNDAGAVWHRAKEESDFAMFAPYLEKLVETQKRFAGYYDSTKPVYDVLLDQYEPGLTMEKADAFFDAIREPLVELTKKVTESPVKIDTEFLHRRYPKTEQAKWSQTLMDVLLIDGDYCTLGETEHPFTAGFTKHDVRITTKYAEDDVAASMYSVLHEGGHAIYELGIGDDVNEGCLGGGTSCAVHESQSRFFENYVGRSENFIHFLYPKMRAAFPEQMADVTEQQLYFAVNQAEPSLIRTESDELTYSLHIMIRYEIEKKLFSDEIQVNELPEVWNRLYQEYLGVDVPDDRHGVLQDSHWSGGAFGYFPTYAIGSAYGAQLIAKMRETMDVDGLIRKGDLAPIKDWLEERIHRHGWMLDPENMMVSCTGEEFDPHYFIDYLTEKFSKIYSL